METHTSNMVPGEAQASDPQDHLEDLAMGSLPGTVSMWQVAGKEQLLQSREAWGSLLKLRHP